MRSGAALSGESSTEAVVLVSSWSGRLRRFLRTFLIADVRGYTRYTREHGDEAASKLAANLAGVVREVVPEFHGDLFELRGDEALSVFFSAREAIRAAVQLQRRLREQRDGEAAFPLGVGMGIDSGEAVPTEGGFRGGALNLAARLCAMAEPGQILASDHCAHLAGRVDGVRLVDRRPRRLKGMEKPVRLVEVVPGVPLPALAVQPVRRLRLASRAFVGMALMVAAGLVGGVVLLWSSAGTGSGAMAPNAVAALNMSGSVVAEARLPDPPSALATAAGAAWVVDSSARSVWRLSGQGGAAVPIPVGAWPVGIAAGLGAVWVTNSADGTVSVINPGRRSQRVVDTVPVGSGPTGITTGLGRVWVANTVDSSLAVIDPRTDRVVKTIFAGLDPTAIAVAGNRVWVTNEALGTVTPVDPGGTAETPVSVGHGPSAVAYGDGSLWVANTLDGTVSQIDPARGDVVHTIPVASRVGGLAFFAGQVWVAAPGAGQIVRIDPDTGAIAGRVEARSPPQALAAGRGLLWTSTSSPPSQHRGGTLIATTASQTGSTLTTSIDPNSTAAWSYVPWETLAVTNDGLTSFKRVGGPAGETVVADLARELPLPTDGGHTYTFHLRPGLHYSDGALIRPEDFRRSIERVFRLNPVALASFNADALKFYGDIVGAETCIKLPHRCDLSNGILTDARTNTVTFHLTRRDPDFLAKLAMPFADAVPPKTPFRDQGTHALPATGPYMLKTYSTHREILVRNPRFRAWSPDAQPAGYPDRIIWKALPNPRAEVAAIEHGRSDFMFNPPPTPQLHEIEARFTDELHPSTWAIVQLAAYMPPALGSPFNKPDARLALNYAVDRRRQTYIEGNTGRPTCQYIPPTFPGYQRYCPFTLHPTRSGRWLAPDLPKAHRLAVASQTHGDRVTILGGVYPHVHDPIARALAHYYARLVQSLGWKPRITHDPSNASLYPGGGWAADYPADSDVFEFFSCPTGNSLQLFCNDSALLTRAFKEQDIDPARSAELWRRADHILSRSAPRVIPLMNPEALGFTSRHVGNYQFTNSPIGAPLLDQMWVK